MNELFRPLVNGHRQTGLVFIVVQLTTGLSNNNLLLTSSITEEKLSVSTVLFVVDELICIFLLNNSNNGSKLFQAAFKLSSYLC